MPSARLIFGLLLATVAIAASACGGSESVPAGAVASVDGTEVTKADLDKLVDQAKRGYKAQKQQFPKVGTPEYQSIQQQYVAILVTLAEYRQAADKLGLKVTDADIDKAEQQTIKSDFAGKRADYEKALKRAGWTRAEYRERFAASALEQKIFDAVTKDVEVTPDEVLAYYTTNEAQFGSPESRDVRHILIAVKDKEGNVDYPASKAKADEVYAQLKAGADFAKLAKQDSADPGSKDSGGKLTISRGQTVPEFDKASFDLATGALSKPVKTSYGYHVIQAVSDVRKATKTPLDKVRDSIKLTLLQQKRNEVMQKWVEDLRKDYDGKVAYATGYEPPELPAEPTSTATQ
ncbi:MAG TPA: peptidylprolyl isomerase [Gaiellaceae bacterium]|jgi:foldase protein PrsA|nr:peptidylprolyl isomerase [Gaiellaceae bacterium]